MNWQVTGTTALVTAVNGLMFPVPVALSIPMPTKLADHLYSVPASGEPLKIMGWLCVFPQIT